MYYRDDLRQVILITGKSGADYRARRQARQASQSYGYAYRETRPTDQTRDQRQERTEASDASASLSVLLLLCRVNSYIDRILLWILQDKRGYFYG